MYERAVQRIFVPANAYADFTVSSTVLIMDQSNNLVMKELTFKYPKTVLNNLRKLNYTYAPWLVNVINAKPDFEITESEFLLKI